MAEGYGQKCVNLEPREPLHKNEMDSFKITQEKSDEAFQLFGNKNYKKAEELAHTVLEKCTEWTEMKKMYIESLLQNNKPKDAITFIGTKLNDDEKKLEDFDYYSAKALYFTSD